MQKKDSKPKKEIDPFRIASLSGITEHSWPIYTIGFKKAADLIVKNARTACDRNTLIFPVLFLYRQYIELSLKEIIGYAQYLSKDSVRQGGHNLKNLWAAARSYIKKYHKEISETEFTAAEDIILELHEIDPTSQASRYPIVKDKSKGRGLVSSFEFDAKPVNIDRLYNKMQKLHAFLEKESTYLSICQDFENEFRSCY